MSSLQDQETQCLTPVWLLNLGTLFSQIPLLQGYTLFGNDWAALQVAPSITSTEERPAAALAGQRVALAHSRAVSSRCCLGGCPPQPQIRESYRHVFFPSPGARG